MSRLLFPVCLFLVSLNDVSCEGLPPLCSKEDINITIHAVTDETLKHSICLYGLKNVAVHTWLEQAGSRVEKPNFELTITEDDNDFQILRVLIRNVTGDDFGEYSVAVMAMARKMSVSSRLRLQILHKIPPRLCQGQVNVTTLVARPGTNAVMTMCFEADMRGENWPTLNVSGHLIKSRAMDHDRVNFTYVTYGSTARRHKLKVSFNNISVNDYGLVNLVLMTGYQAKLKFAVRIRANATCGVLFKVKEVDEYEKSFTLICRSSCYPSYIHIGMKMQSFYRTTLYNPRANMTRELRDGPRHFSCADEGIYVCNITYYGGETVVKQRIVDFQSCHHNASTKARSSKRIL